MLRWIFLDVGNLLLDEDPLTYLVFRRHVEAVRQVRPELGFAELLARREELDGAGAPWPLAAVVAAYLEEGQVASTWAAVDREVRARYAELSPAIPGAAALVAWLAGRFRLGLIANQPRECRAQLARLGLLDRFEVVALSEEEGVFKPDPELFRRALGRAGVAPAEALMVGDRLDHDVAPAAALGLATARVRWPRRARKGWLPYEPEAAAYLASLERAAARREAGWRHARRGIEVDTVDDLAVALASWPPTAEGVL